MQNRMIRSVRSCATAALAALAIFAADASAQTLSLNSDPTATLHAGVRYRNFSAGLLAEVHVFNAPYGGATTNGQHVWGFPEPVSITYANGVLSTTIDGNVTSRNVGAPAALNYIEIQITKNGLFDLLNFRNLSLNGGPSLGSAAVFLPNTRVWKITGADLTSGFTLTGDINIIGVPGSGDTNFVQVQVGYAPPPDNEGPIASNVTTNPEPALLNGSVTVTGAISDETTGNSNVASAEYQIDGGGWTQMSAQDGAFDSPAEDVEATFTATTVGTHEVCVRGVDAIGNIGVAACQNYLVTYKFTGFFEPIDNVAVNTVKAGQSIPSKWRLTDANDVPITSPTSFVGLSSYSISCTDFAGDPTDAIEEVAAGSSGLQYSGDGYWQFNWKTPKSYANTCRAMYVEFDSGATSPVAKFAFKK